MTEPTLRILSLGAGVQSSVLALLASRDGEKLFGGVPDFAVFADTQAEPQAVYDHLDWLEGELNFPVKRCTAGNLREDVMAGLNSTGQRFITIPAFLVDADGRDVNISRRQCTSNYKVHPIRRAVREELGLAPGQRVPRGVYVEQWLGISVDEAYRMKESQDSWQHNRWPLIEREITRADCANWFEERYPGRQLPRSACTFCPYHNDREWLHLRDNDPESWADAVRVDERLRHPDLADAVGDVDGQLYLHQSGLPLSEARLKAEASEQLNLFGNECEGMCGV